VSVQRGTSFTVATYVIATLDRFETAGERLSSSRSLICWLRSRRRYNGSSKDTRAIASETLPSRRRDGIDFPFRRD